MDKTVKTPISSFAQFAQADIKGSTFADAYRIAQVRTAVYQAQNGNNAPMSEALTFAQAKDRKSTAWRDALSSVGTVTLVPRKGALSLAENKDIREQIESVADKLSLNFGIAFAASLKTQAEVAKQKRLANFSQGKVDKSATKPAPAPAQQQIDNPVDTVETMILSGTLSTADAQRLIAALQVDYTLTVQAAIMVQDQLPQPAIH
jgi:hypothetical protein